MYPRTCGFAVILGLFLLDALPAFGIIIPPDRRTVWQAGVPGGIPNRSIIFANVKNPPYNAKADGVTDDSAAIQSAINACPSNQVVYLPTGTYRVNGQIVIYGKSYWTLRGDGPGKTILTGNGSTVFTIGAVPWMAQWPAPNAITAGTEQGSTSITVSGTTGLVVGQLMVIEQSNDGTVVFGYGVGGGSGAVNTDDRLNNNAAVLNQRMMVTGISGNQVTFTPPLNFPFTPSLGPRAIGYNGVVGPKFAGLEDITVNGSPVGEAVRLQGCYAFWLKDVEITGWQTIGLHPSWCASCEIRHCYFHDPGTYGSSQGYAIQFDTDNNVLFEDNIIWHNQAGLMLQGGSSGNVFGYNFAFQAYDVYAGIDWEGAVLEAHTPYPCMNLFEGNYANGLHFDFYYGPSSTTTLLRNYFTGTDPDIRRNRVCVSFDSHQWSNSVVGNVLGSIGTHAPLYAALPGTTITWANTTPLNWTYDPGTANFPESTSVIFRLGYPYTGNSGSSGSSADGTTNHLTYIDLLVRSNTLIHGNWDYAHQAVVWDPTIADHTIPGSYYLTSKPAWFGNLAWPPYDPAQPASAGLTNLPAGYRFVMGTNPPPSQAESVLAIARVANGWRLDLTGGQPATSYQFQRAPELVGPWVTRATVTADSNGYATWVDTAAPTTQSFYRVSPP